MTAMWWAAGALGVLALAAGLLALWRRGRAGRPIRGYLDLIDDLSPAQRARVEAIRREFLPRVEAIRAGLRGRRALLAELLFAEPIDRPAIDQAVAAILADQAALERQVIEHIIEERELLDPAQRRQFHDIIVGQFSGGGLGVHDVRAAGRPLKRR